MMDVQVAVRTARREVVQDFSLEITAKDIPSLKEAAHLIPAGTTISVTSLPGEHSEVRLAAIRAIREMGFEPMLHCAARTIRTVRELEQVLVQGAKEAQLTRCMIIAGDTADVAGPFSDSLSLIETGVFEQNGIRVVGVGGHPDGHPHMSLEQCWAALEAKCSAISQKGMSPLVVTQFAFDPDRIIQWIGELRTRLDVAVRVGVPGPANIRTLIRFAARCGVGASASVLAKYGISIGQLLGAAGPDKFVEGIAHRISEVGTDVRLHFYPFGGVSKALDWIEQYKCGR